MSGAQLTSRNWFGKASAGFILGFGLALGLGSIFLELTASGNPLFNAQGQVAMWLISPIWTGVLGFCFLFGTGMRAWGWLACANLLVWALYAAIRMIAG